MLVSLDDQRRVLRERFIKQREEQLAAAEVRRRNNDVLFSCAPDHVRAGIYAVRKSETASGITVQKCGGGRRIIRKKIKGS